MQDRNPRYSKCSATLVNPAPPAPHPPPQIAGNWAVTAAHCVDAMNLDEDDPDDRDEGFSVYPEKYLSFWIGVSNKANLKDQERAK